MAQDDLFIGPQPSGLELREGVNAALEALATFSAGPTPPVTTYADKFYFNTATGLLWKRTSANDAWVRAPLIPGPVATTAAMSALDGASHPAGSVVLCLANATPGDGAGGWFEARASGIAADGVDVFAHDAGGALRWHRLNALGGATNLSIGTHDATQLVVASDTGTDATLPLATLPGGTNLSGLLSPAEKDKLAGIETGATADQTGAEMVSAIDAELGSTVWQGGGGGGSGGYSSRDVWYKETISETITPGVPVYVTITAAGVNTTDHAVGPIKIPTTNPAVHGTATITADDTIVARLNVTGDSSVAVSGDLAVPVAEVAALTWYTAAYAGPNPIPSGITETVVISVPGVDPDTDTVTHIDAPSVDPMLVKWATITAVGSVTVSLSGRNPDGVTMVGNIGVAVAPSSYVAATLGTLPADVAANYADLITRTADMVYLKCYSNADDGGGGYFEARESGATIDYGHVVANGKGGDWRYHRLGVNKGIANVCHFGAQGSGDVAHRTSNTTAFQRAIDYLSAVSAVDYNGGYALIVPKGAGEYYIDGEITVPTTVAEFHVLGIGRVTISQYTDGAGHFVFTKNQTGTPTSLHRFVLIRDITFSWFSFQQLADFRSNAVMLTNAPDGSAGHTFGFTFEQCKFERGRCGFTLIKTGDVSWTDAETDAWTAGGFVQTVCFDKCSFYYMSGGGYYVSDTSAGGPQLLFRNINSTHGYDSGGRVKILEREFIYVNHAQVVTIDDLEFLMADRALIYCGNSHNVKLTQIAFEFYNMADQSQAMRFNGADTFFTVDGIRIQNSTFPADRWIVATYQATGRVMGSCLAYNNTSTTGLLYFCGRYAGSTGTIGWDANAKYTANNATCAAADNSNVTTWAPSAITNT